MDPRRGQDDLLTRHRAGDPLAFDLLVRELAPRLMGYFLRQGADPASAEDLTQNVFVRILQSLDRYQSSGQMEAFFLRIARNLWIDQQRRGARFRRVEDGEDAVDSRPGPESESQTHDRASVVRAALAELEPAERELLELAVLQRLPYRDVSDLLDIPVGTVKSRVFYALRRLRERLAALGEE